MFEKGERREVEVEEFMDIIGEIVNVHDKLSCFEAAQAIFPAVCPKSLVNREVEEIITMESFCRDYRVSPVGANIGYLDYPIMLVDMFGTVSIARERWQAKAAKAARAEIDQQSRQATKKAKRR